jgi:protein gp37
MADKWTDATWSPVVGCTKVSPGCDHCYAETMARRLRAMGRPEYQAAHDGAGWTGRAVCIPERLEQPLKWRKLRHVFVVSMGDLFHIDVPNEYIAAVFGVMAATPQHTFQILTKRPGSMLAWFRWFGGRANGGGTGQLCIAHANDSMGRWGEKELDGSPAWPLPNVWLGTTCEDQQRADERIPLLLQCPAAVRFVSVEPMLGEIDLGLQSATCNCCPRWSSRWVRLKRHVKPEPILAATGIARGCWAARGGIYRATSNRHGALCIDTPGGRLGIKPDEFDCLPSLDWVICGGEFGHGARPMHLDWVRSLRDQCQAAEVRFFYKQGPGDYGSRHGKLPVLDGRILDDMPWRTS